MTKVIIILPIRNPQYSPPIQAQYFVYNKTHGCHIYKDTEFTVEEFNKIIDEVLAKEYDWTRPSVRVLVEEDEPEYAYKDLQASVSDELDAEDDEPNFEPMKRRGRPRKLQY